MKKGISFQKCCTQYHRGDTGIPFYMDEIAVIQIQYQYGNDERVHSANGGNG